MMKNKLKKKFLEYSFPLKKNDVLQKKALTIKDAIFPNFIFKYRTFDNCKHAINNLVDNVVRLSDPSTFNDPYDSKFYIDIEATNKLTEDTNPYKKDFDKKFEQLNSKAKDEILKLQTDIDERRLDDNIKTFQKTLKICSFSTICNSNLMWTHYSDNHTGFCIEYNSLLMERDNDTIFPLFPVIYDKDLLDITNFIKLKEEERNDTHLIKATLTKSIEWSYEEEWRLIIQTNLKRNKKYNTSSSYSMHKPKAIYMGLKISKENETILLNICKDKKIPLYKMARDSKEYKLNRIPIDYTKTYT